ncbi:hypothetical protein SAMN05444321_3001 [Bradyrhizobium lablabi]|nr:hypothetical protein SAMN05444321_3001 [Bradyrhizobium lablabi]
MESSRSTRRFKPPWTLIRENSECYTVQDANGVTVLDAALKIVMGGAEKEDRAAA